MNDIKENDRKEFLIEMYNQMWNNITRQITLPWQGISVVLSSLALFYFSEKNIISLDLSSSLIILLCIWLLAHVYDSSNWYNRNISIVANIEKQFLLDSDLREIHYFFKDHIGPKKIILTFKIQQYLAFLIIIVTSLYHLFDQIIPSFTIDNSVFDPKKCLPYIILVVGLTILIKIRKHCIKEQKDFDNNSPGRKISI